MTRYVNNGRCRLLERLERGIDGCLMMEDPSEDNSRTLSIYCSSSTRAQALGKNVKTLAGTYDEECNVVMEAEVFD